MHFYSRLLLLVFLFYFQKAEAENIQVLPEPGWLYKVKPNKSKSPIQSSVSNGYYIEFADQQVHLGIETEYNHIIRHIINETGVQNGSEVSVNFAPEYQKVIFHKIILRRNGQMISQLNANQIKVVQEETDRGSFQYNGIKRAFVTLTGVQKDDRIDFSYSIIGFNPVYENRYCDKLYFSSANEIGNFFQTYIVPENRKLNFKTFNNATAPVETRQGNVIIYHWNNPPIKIYETQNLVPMWFDNYPHVTVSEFNSWKDVAEWSLKLYNHYDYTFPENLEKKISSWRAISKGDKEMYANLATRFVQDEIRYLGIETGINTHKPHTPAEVFQQKFGDCKDKALLLASILQRENIPAYVALVNTTLRTKLNLTAPSLNEFDHAIVAVERSNGFVFVDATVSFQRGEFSTTYIPDYGYALLIREGETQLQAIEPGYPNSSTIEEKLELPFDDSSRLLVNTVYKGGAADNIRSNYAEMSIKEMGESCLQYYAKYFDGISQSRQIETLDDSLRNEFTLNEFYAMPSIWQVDKEGKKSVDIFVKSVFEKITDPSGAYKDAPIAIGFPLALRYSLEIKLDEKWDFPIEELHIKNDSYQFDFTPIVKGNIIELRYFYKTFKDHIPENEVAAYKSAYKQIESNFTFNFSKAGAGIKLNDTKDGPTGNLVNWLAVLIFLLTATGLISLFKFLSKKSIETPYTAGMGQSLGGPVLFLGFSLGLSGLLQLWRFISDSYFSAKVWENIGTAGGDYYQLIFMTEMISAIFCISFIGFLLLLYIKRRDIFPKMFMAYIAGFIGTQILTLILYSFAKTNNLPLETTDDYIFQLIRSLIYGAIWTTYILRSERVKNTFIFPFENSKKVLYNSEEEA